MTQPDQTVYIVDDDDAVRDSLMELLDSVGINSLGHESAQEFLDSFNESMEGCILLDVRMPGMSGPELQQVLADMGSVLPIIFITGHGDVPMAVEAMKKGAVEFIQKPFRDQELLDCVQSTLKTSHEKHVRQSEKNVIRDQLNTLTAREREILDLIVDGHSNKVIAIDLGISQRTVENHRASVLEKMEVHSTATLVKLVLSSSE